MGVSIPPILLCFVDEKIKMKMFKCRFCERISEFRSNLFKHIEVAHEENIIQEVYKFDDDDES